jgi:uncharacterized membrane protein YcfT
MEMTNFVKKNAIQQLVDNNLDRIQEDHESLVIADIVMVLAILVMAAPTLLAALPLLRRPYHGCTNIAPRAPKAGPAKCAAQMSRVVMEYY